VDVRGLHRRPRDSPRPPTAPCEALHGGGRVAIRPLTLPVAAGCRGRAARRSRLPRRDRALTTGTQVGAPVAVRFVAPRRIVGSAGAGPVSGSSLGECDGGPSPALRTFR